MTELFTSSDLELSPRAVNILREEIFVSSEVAAHAGIRNSGKYCVFGIQSLFPGGGDEEYAARLVISPDVDSGQIQVNQHFLADTGFLPDDERFWYVRSAPQVVSVRQVVIEHALDQGNVDREINDLRYQRRDLFVNRCMLVEPGKDIKDLTLRMQGRANFYFRDIKPGLDSLRDKAILVFEDNTQINLFIPHRKSGVDIVVVVDGSGSMDLDDFLYDGRRRTRLDGVKVALNLLFQVKLVSGSRVSSIAAVVFGRNAKMLYPYDIEMVKLENEFQLNEIRDSIKLISDPGLAKIRVDRGGTIISNGIKLAGDLLDLYAQENNEKMIILLSDGADWQEDSEDKIIGEIVLTGKDPAVLADSMHQDSNIRIHTIGISDRATFAKYYPQHRDHVGSVPNEKLLEKIAISTDGMFLESPSADLLAKIFEDLGVGATYPIN